MDEKEKAQIAREGQMLEGKLKYLKAELEKLTLTLVELEKAKATINGAKVNEEALVPIGADIMMAVEVKDEHVLVPLGAGYYVRMKKEDALKKIDEGLERLKEVYNRINEEVKASEGQLIDLLRRAQGVG